MFFLSLRSMDGNTTLVNCAHIVRVTESTRHNVSIIELSDSKVSLTVNHTLTDIARALDCAGEFHVVEVK